MLQHYSAIYSTSVLDQLQVIKCVYERTCMFARKRVLFLGVSSTLKNSYLNWNLYLCVYLISRPSCRTNMRKRQIRKTINYKFKKKLIT